MATKEVWKPIPGHKGYEVSNRGNVRSLDRWVTDKNGKRRFHRGKLLHPSPMKSGHLLVHLGGAHLNNYVHHLVARVFIGKRPKGLKACHNNGNPAYNRPGNLRYDTQRGNCGDTVKHGRTTRGERQIHSKLTAAQVEEIKQSEIERRQLEKRWRELSRRNLAKKYGVSDTQIRAVVKGRAWKWLK